VSALGNAVTAKPAADLVELQAEGFVGFQLLFRPTTAMQHGGMGAAAKELADLCILSPTDFPHDVHGQLAWDGESSIAGVRAKIRNARSENGRNGLGNLVE
jgi:hypothetical protein